MTPDLAIVIVTFNAAEHVVRCLESIRKAPPSILHEIVVVDNASSDGTVTAIRTNWPSVRILEIGSNIGFGAANNRGARATDSPLLLFLNGDTEVSPGAIDRLVDELRLRPRAAAVGPRIVDAHGRIELSIGRMAGPVTELIQKCVGRGLEQGRAWAERYVERQARTAREVEWVSGACLLVHHPDFTAAGLFDERFFLYFEDVDLCSRLRAMGRQIWFTPEAEVRHARGRSRVFTPDATEHAYRRSQITFYAKHHPRWLPVLKLYLGMRGRLPDEPEPPAPARRPLN